jgi:L-ascorbate metabolism protein UlaG (beta-lactamase superfamily)
VGRGRLTVGNATVFVDAIAPDPASGQAGPELKAGAGRNFALATHYHSDHCDVKALGPVLGERGYLVCAEETARYIDARAVRLETSRLYEPVFLSRGDAEFAVFAVPAEDGLGAPQVSWVIDASGKRLIHCGDTCWHGHWRDIARAYGPFDLAFLPINGFRQTEGRFIDDGIPMSMTGREAAEAAHLLNAKAAVPIHYGSTAENYQEEPNALQEFLQAAASRGIVTRPLRPGETATL